MPNGINFPAGGLSGLAGTQRFFAPAASGGGGGSLLEELGRGLQQIAANRRAQEARELQQRRLSLSERQVGLQEQRFERELAAKQQVRSSVGRLIDENPEILQTSQGKLQVATAIARAGNLDDAIKWMESAEDQKLDLARQFVQGKNIELAERRVSLEEQKFEAERTRGGTSVSSFGKLLQDRNRALEAGRVEDVKLIDEQIAKVNAPKKGVTVNVGGEEPTFKVPTGFMLKNPEDPGEGLQPIPGGPQDKQAIEAATKTNALKIARDNIKPIRETLLNDDGTVDRSAVATSRVSIPFTGTKGIPGTKGSTVATMYEVGIQAITRAETGAAMAPSELSNTRARFQPSPLDSEEVVKTKLELYEDFLNGSLDLIRPDGKFDVESFEAEKARRLGQDTAGGLNDLERQAEEAIAAGADADIVRQRLEELRRGR